MKQEIISCSSGHYNALQLPRTSAWVKQIKHNNMGLAQSTTTASIAMYDRLSNNVLIISRYPCRSGHRYGRCHQYRYGSSGSQLLRKFTASAFGHLFNHERRAKRQIPFFSRSHRIYSRGQEADLLDFREVRDRDMICCECLEALCYYSVVNFHK